MEGAAAATAASTAANINLLELIHQGWYATYPLILFSVIVTSIMIERLWVLGGLAGGIQRFTEEVCDFLRHGDLTSAATLIEQRRTKTKEPAARIYAGLLPLIRKGGIEEILEYGERRRLDEGRLLRRNIWVLGTVGASAPFIGLFGTVMGIIKSFHQMAVMGTGGFAVVAAGISEALIATALGLVVAIIAVICFNYLQTKIGNLDTLLRVGLGQVLEAADLGGVHGAQ
jgi:biopolymer transport protein ExbB